jgi:hypothetical protein
MVLWNKEQDDKKEDLSGLLVMARSDGGCCTQIELMGAAAAQIREVTW